MRPDGHVAWRCGGEGGLEKGSSKSTAAERMSCKSRLQSALEQMHVLC